MFSKALLGGNGFSTEGPLPCAYDVCAQKNAMAIQNEFFAKFFSIVSPLLLHGWLRVAAIHKS
jgi:hypothetical protein